MNLSFQAPFKQTVSAAIVLAALLIFGSPTASAQSGSGTNALTTFSIGKTYLNVQNSAGPPTPPTTPAYSFIATTVLSSNRTANNISLTLPSGGTSNLLQNFVLPAEYLLFASDTNQARFESTFPQGDYVFKVAASSSNQQVTATLPASMSQPNAPHISNWTAAQSLDVAEAFTLTWDAFQGGTASDFILLTVGNNNAFGNNAFQSGSPGTSNVLTGTATSVTIPAGKLLANSNYVANIGFYHIGGTSNATYTAGAYRLTVTQFHINTIGTASTLPAMSKPVWGGGGFSFDVATLPGQVLKVLFSTDSSLPITTWTTLLSTNPVGTSVHLTIPPQAGPTGFFRIKE